MEYVKAKWSLLAKVAFVGFVVVVLFVAGYYTGFLKSNCGQDINCFNEKLKKCSPASVLILKDNNVYSYAVGSSIGSKCEIKVRLERVEVGASPEFKELLEGKSMKCTIPKVEIRDINLDQFDNLLKYCHGQLKEGLYEIIIQRMYSNIVSNLGSIVEEAKKNVK